MTSPFQGGIGLTAGVVLLTICSISISPTIAQQTSASRIQLPAVIQYDGEMASILAHLPEIYGVTIGLEVDAQEPQSQVEFYLRDPTLSDVLNAIVKSAPRYQWRESDGFIEVFPVAGSSPLLDTMISSFRCSDVDEAGAINQLLKLPEMQANMRTMSLHGRAQGGTSTEKKGEKAEKFSVNLEGVTLRQALHKIAKDSGGRFWIFRNYSDGFFAISNWPW
jgi:hypothetical protein